MNAVHDSRGATNLGIIMIVIGVFALSLSDALVKYVSPDFSLWQIYVVRSLIAIVLLLAIFLGQDKLAALKPVSVGWVVVRSLLLTLMWLAYYAALPWLTLSVAAIAMYTTPLFIALFGAVLIGESVGPRRWVGIAIGFVGVLVVLQPGTDTFSVATVLPLFAAVCYALAMVVTRSKCRNERPLVLALGLNVCLLILGIIGTAAICLLHPVSSISLRFPFLLSSWGAMGSIGWGLMSLLALLVIVANTGVAKAYQVGPSAVIGTFDYAYLVFAVCWGLLFFADVPDLAMLVGMALIVSAGHLVLKTAR